MEGPGNPVRGQVWAGGLEVGVSRLQQTPAGPEHPSSTWPQGGVLQGHWAGCLLKACTAWGREQQEAEVEVRPALGRLKQENHRV